MRILILSNFFPPHYIGGYELGCKDVAERLRERGHDVRVLTSTYKVGKPQRDGEVYRWLRCDMRLFLSDETPHSGSRGASLVNLVKHPARVLALERINQQAMRKVCAEFKPDLVYAWNLRGVGLSHVYIARDLGIPVTYFISDNWLSLWEADPWYQLFVSRERRRVTQLFMKPFSLMSQAMRLQMLNSPPELSHVQFCSQFLKDQALKTGKPVENAEVVRWCVDMSAWPFREEMRRPSKLLFAGQTIPSKGVQTAIKAVAYLRRMGHRNVTLTIAGGSALAAHDAKVRQLINTLHLKKEVHFVGRMPRHELRELYHSHDILVFPTIGDEPFAITPLEAMSSGMAVVGTLTGGSPELFRNNVTALTFDKGNALACARRIEKLLLAPNVVERLRRNGRKIIEERHTFDKMMDAIEGCLHRAVNSDVADACLAPADNAYPGLSSGSQNETVSSTSKATTAAPLR